jgi:hypothetical protein
MIHTSFDRFYRIICNKGDNLIKSAGKTISKKKVERFFLCSLCRAIFDRYSDELIKDSYRPCQRRSHKSEKKPKVYKRIRKNKPIEN